MKRVCCDGCGSQGQGWMDGEGWLFGCGGMIGGREGLVGGDGIGRRGMSGTRIFNNFKHRLIERRDFGRLPLESGDNAFTGRSSNT